MKRNVAVAAVLAVLLCLLPIGALCETVAEGSFDDYGSNQDATFKGVRPAMWITLD